MRQLWTPQGLSGCGLWTLRPTHLLLELRELGIFLAADFLDLLRSLGTCILELLCPVWSRSRSVSVRASRTRGGHAGHTSTSLLHDLSRLLLSFEKSRDTLGLLRGHGGGGSGGGDGGRQLQLGDGANE